MILELCHDEKVNVSELLVHVPLPRHEARRLVAAVLGVEVTRLDPNRELTPSEAEAVAALQRRRLAGEPLQYLEGTAAFGPFELVVDDRVLIPRPETEQLWELATALVSDPAVVVDLGTGSGALAVALSRSFPRARVVATDVSSAALEVAALNVERCGATVELVCGDVYEALPSELRGRVDLLVSNPPYVAEGEWGGLADDVRHEPRRALVAGPRGTELVERILDGLGEWLAPEGVAAIEIGATQGGALADHGRAAGWAVELHRDLAGRDRFLVVRR